MVVVDRYFLMGVTGILLAILFAAGEFLGWWDQFGEFGFWSSIVFAMAGFLLNASRTQGKLILQGLRDLRGTTAEAVAGVGRVEQGIGRVEQGIGRVEQGIGRVEQGIGRVEQGIGRVEQGIGRLEQGVGRIDTNTAESVLLLREIRDRLPRPPAG